MTTISRESELRQQLIAAAVPDALAARFLDAILESPALDTIAAQVGRASGLPIAGFDELLGQDGVTVAPVVDGATFGLDLGMPAALRLDLSGFGVGGLGLALRHTPGAGAGETSGALRGAMRVGGVEIPVDAAIAVGAEAALAISIASLPLAALVEEVLGEPLPAEVPNFTLENVALSVAPASGAFSLGAMATSEWQLPIGVSGVVVREVAVALSRAAGEGGAMAVAGSIGGTLALGPASVSVSYEFPGRLELGGELPAVGLSPLVQALCGSGAVQDLPVAPGILALELSDLRVALRPQERMFSCSGASDLGRAELVVAPTGAGAWAFSVGFAPPESWRFSALDSSLAGLDGLSFAGTALVLASSDDSSMELATIALPREEVAVARGLNLFASLDVTGTGVDAITGLASLSVYAAIGPNPADMVIEAAIDGHFELGQGVAFGGARLRLVPSPANFSITLLGTVTAAIDTSVLTFTGGMQVTPRSAALQATMEGMWHDPFSVRGVAVGNVALDLGVTFGPLLPTVGIAGSLQVGGFAGAAAVRVDTGMPSRSMLAVAFNRLFLMDIIRTFCGPTVTGQIPPLLAERVLNVGFEDVDIYIVPQETRIGELVFEQGIRARGHMDLWGLRAYGSVEADYLEGVELHAEVEPFSLGGVFALTGARGHTKASAHLKVSPLSVPVVEINGAVELLGLRSETIITFSERGFFFLTEGRIFDSFSASVEATGSDISSGGDFRVRVAMKNDLTSYLRDEASKAIRAAAEQATRDIAAAQARVASAQAEVERLNGEIERQRAIVRGERERDAQRLREARAAVERAQAEVDRLNGEIERQRAIVRGERERDAGRLREAQAAVGAAQREVNRIQGEIDGTKRRIAQLEGEINAKRRELDGLSKWNPRRAIVAAELAAIGAKNGAEITGLYAKIGGLETGKHGAMGVLEAAKATLRGLEAAANQAPVDADPRVAGLFAGREGAGAGLAAAQQTLRGLEAAANQAPVDADPRVAGLFAGLGVARAGLVAAQETLGAVRLGVGEMAAFAEEVARYSLGGLLDVRAASFEGGLALASGGVVEMSVTLSLMQRPAQTVRLAFSFHDPVSAARALARQLMPAHAAG